MAEKEEEISEDWVVCDAPPPTVETKKKKKWGYSFWKYLGWGSSSKTTSEPKTQEEEDVPTAVIHDTEILDCLSTPPIDDQEVEEQPPATTAAVEKLESDKVYPVDQLTTHQDVFEYLDQLIEMLQNHDGQDTPQVKMPEVPVLSEKLNTTVELAEKMTREYFERLDEEDRKRREDAELIQYFEQLARELDNSEDSDLPALISASDDTNTDEVFGQGEWEDFQVKDYLHELAEIVVDDSPNTPNTPVDSNKRRRPVKGRPPTPYHFSENDTSEEELPMKRCKMTLEDEESDLEPSENTSELLSRLERGECEQGVLFNNGSRVIRRKRPAQSPLKQHQALAAASLENVDHEENKFHKLLDRIMADDDDDTTTESTTEETVLEMICEEFSELADSITQMFRRSPC